jgi:hypothetical protein
MLDSKIKHEEIMETGTAGGFTLMWYIWTALPMPAHAQTLSGSLAHIEI